MPPGGFGTQEQLVERTALFLGGLVDDARQEGRHGSAA